MKTRDVKVVANQEVPDSEGGTLLVLQSLSAGEEVEITWLDARGSRAGTVKGVTPGRKYRPGFTFSGYLVKGTEAADARFIIAGGDADAELAESTVLVTNDSANAVPVDLGAVVVADRVQVDIGGGAINVTADNVGLVPNGVSISEPAAVAVTDALTAVLAADADALSVRLYNQGPDPVAIGGAGLTWAKRAVVLEAGDSFVEEVAAALALSAICDAGGAATLGVQVVKSV